MKNKSYKSITIALIVVCALVFSSCSNKDTSKDSLDLPDDNVQVSEPDIVGEIIEIENENILRVLIESTSTSINGQVWVAINDETIFLDNDDTEFTPKDIASLFKVGETASILSNGTIMESYPMQTTAVTVFVS